MLVTNFLGVKQFADPTNIIIINRYNFVDLKNNKFWWFFKILYKKIEILFQAPRAKMNQQRSRRFRASKETQEKIEEVARIRSELQAKGAYLPPERPKEAHFDSNCITPGTPFMDRLSKCLHYYIHDRLDWFLSTGFFLTI